MTLHNGNLHEAALIVGLGSCLLMEFATKPSGGAVGLIVLMWVPAVVQERILENCWKTIPRCIMLRDQIVEIYAYWCNG
jgi:hypothetical protein